MSKAELLISCAKTSPYSCFHISRIGNLTLPLIRPEILVSLLIPLFEIPSFLPPNYNQNLTTSDNGFCYLPWAKSPSCSLYYWNSPLIGFSATLISLLFTLDVAARNEPVKIEVKACHFSAQNPPVVPLITQSENQSPESGL